MTYFHLTLKSANAKTGPIPVTVTGNQTCPQACPLSPKKNKNGEVEGRGCYASLSHLGMHWRKVTEGYRGTNFNEFCQKLSELPENQLLRINAAGDLPGKSNRINGKQLIKLSNSLKNKRPIIYTHKPVLGNSFAARQNRRHIKNSGLNVNLSANNISEVDKLVKLKIGPVVTIVPENSPKTIFTKDGNKIIQCPATHSDTNCAKCQLCSKQRSVVVAFPAHGIQKGKVNLIASSNA